MGVNYYKPHLFILPEDDANRQIANGFVKAITGRNVQVLAEAGGWLVLLDRFQAEYAAVLDRNPRTHLVLILDFDNEEGRMERVWARIPERFRERVFVVGARGTPEELRHQLGSYETIGEGLASDCRDNANALWGHGMLRHNAEEVQRFRQSIRWILFPE